MHINNYNLILSLILRKILNLNVYSSHGEISEASFFLIITKQVNNIKTPALSRLIFKTKTLTFSHN